MHRSTNLTKENTTMETLKHTSTLAKGQKVSFTFFGIPVTATIKRVANGIVWLDNGRWMHAESVTPVAGRSKRAKALRIRCNQCEITRINGVICHETGCQNTNARYDADSGEWIKQRKCFECGSIVDADETCCNGEEN